jgi:hypothetical protein
MINNFEAIRINVHLFTGRMWDNVPLREQLLKLPPQATLSQVWGVRYVYAQNMVAALAYPVPDAEAEVIVAAKAAAAFLATRAAARVLPLMGGDHPLASRRATEAIMSAAKAARLVGSSDPTEWCESTATAAAKAVEAANEAAWHGTGLQDWPHFRADLRTLLARPTV